jgi:uncharacterized membrane protein YfcA
LKGYAIAAVVRFMIKNKFLKYHLYIIGLVLGPWLIYMFWSAKYSLFIENWFVSAIMVLGAFVAGASSEGGGAIAFPTLTLLYDVDPHVARNFSLAIQSIGMTAATFVIFKLKIPVEKKALLFASLGGAVGIILGSFLVAPFVPSKPTKLLFVSLWLSFAIALYLINKNKTREIYKSIPHFAVKDKYKLVLYGVLGGIVSSIFGNGLDIFTFCLLTLHYKINEKVATSTSVALMAFNSMVGFLLHLVILRDFQVVAFNYWLVAIPVVIIFAPLGTVFINSKPRQFVTGLLYAIIITQFIGAFVILRPSIWSVVYSVAILVAGGLFFWKLSLNNYDLPQSIVPP